MLLPRLNTFLHLLKSLFIKAMALIFTTILCRFGLSHSISRNF